MSKKILENDWAPLLEEEFQKPYYLRLREFLKEEYAEKTVYPPIHDIFNAFKLTPYHNVKVVLLGQARCKNAAFAKKYFQRITG